MYRKCLVKQSIPWRIYVYQKVFVAWPPPFSVSPSLRLMYHVCNLGAVMSLPTNAISKEEKKGRHR